MQRVIIMGSAGSGKSTLAKLLGEITGLPVFHVDQYYWSPGWQRRAIDEAATMIEDIAAKSAWVFEGNNLSSFHSRAKRADTLILLGSGPN